MSHTVDSSIADALRDGTLPPFKDLGETVRQQRLQELAQNIIDIVGVGHVKNGIPNLCLVDVRANGNAILELLPQAWDTLSSKERSNLYFLNKAEEPAPILARTILKAAGYTLLTSTTKQQINKIKTSCFDWQIDKK